MNDFEWFDKIGFPLMIFLELIAKTSTVATVSLVLKYHLASVLHSKPNTMARKPFAFRCMVMVPPIRDKSLRFTTWPSYGMCQPFSFAKITVSFLEFSPSF